jgi:hypothetical protein
MTNKHSLKMLDGHEDLQAKFTGDAFLFAQLMGATAKKNSLTRQQIINEACREPDTQRKIMYTGRAR